MARYTSSDGLLSSSDPNAIVLWEGIIAKQASETARWTELLRGLGVKLAHPDDGWVDPTRQARLRLSWYPQFNDHPEVGDLIALGWPRTGYRLVEVTAIDHTPGRMVYGTWFDDVYVFDFNDTGRRLPEPPRKSLWARLRKKSNG